MKSAIIPSITAIWAFCKNNLLSVLSKIWLSAKPWVVVDFNPSMLEGNPSNEFFFYSLNSVRNPIKVTSKPTSNRKRQVRILHTTVIWFLPIFTSAFTAAKSETQSTPILTPDKKKWNTNFESQCVSWSRSIFKKLYQLNFSSVMGIWSVRNVYSREKCVFSRQSFFYAVFLYIKHLNFFYFT